MVESSRKTQSGQPGEPKFSKVFRDPVHDLIRLGPDDKFILDLIETKEFQRLRRIRQLGLAYLVYPGAEHSRFTHSLGVFNFARRMIEELHTRSDSKIQEELRENARIVKAAALLHDLGHGPFSHVWERAFPNDGGALHHEEWTSRILLSDSTDVAKVLKDHKIDMSLLVPLICDTPPNKMQPPKEPYLKDIVHSQHDADRMDYLLRDSLMTGSRYGEFDSEWILNILALGALQSGEKHVKKLCLDYSKGTGAIEKMLHARLLMTKHVYGHKTTRAYEAELVRTLQLASHLADVLPEDTPAVVCKALKQRGCLDVDDYLMLDDQVVWWALRQWAVWPDKSARRDDKLVENLQRHGLRLVRRSRPWKMVPLTTPQQQRGATELHKELTRDEGNTLQFEYYLDEMTCLPYKDPAVAIRYGADPEQAYFEDIHVLEDGAAVPILDAQKSSVLEALSETRTEPRFYFDREYSKEFDGLLSKYGIC